MHRWNLCGQEDSLFRVCLGRRYGILVRSPSPLRFFCPEGEPLVYFATGPCSEFRQSDRVPADFFTLPIGTFRVGFARIF